jgi:hypothetical protein
MVRIWILIGVHNRGVIAVTDIYFDLDEVLRNTNRMVFGHTNGRYNWEQKVEGMTYVEYINKHLEILVDAPPTPYLKVVRKYFPQPRIATFQPAKWMPYTQKWLDRHIPNAIVYNFDSFAAKWHSVVVELGGILVEDSPRLPSYKGVAIIDFYYNRRLQPTHFPENNKPMKRIHNYPELEKFIKDVM